MFSLVRRIPLSLAWALFVVAIMATAAIATEGKYTQNCLPPADPYVGSFHALYLAGLINLSDPIHSDFTACDPPPPSVSGAFTVHSFSSIVRFNISQGGGPPQPNQAPANVTVRVAYNSTLPGSKDVFDTEMLALTISGGTLPPGVMIRESPTLASTGQTTIRPIAGGLYAIDSFFDIFTELSIDGGQTWAPSESGAGRMELSPSVPTPVRAFTWGQLKTIYR